MAGSVRNRAAVARSAPHSVHRTPGQRPTACTEHQVSAPQRAPNARSAPHSVHRTPGQRPTACAERQVSAPQRAPNARSEAGGTPEGEPALEVLLHRELGLELVTQLDLEEVVAGLGTGGGEAVE